MSAFRKTGVVPFNPEIFKTPEVTSNEEKPKSRKERANVRTIKLLLLDINKKVEQAVNKPQERKRKYVIPTSGAAITEDESELSETQNYAYWYARFFPGTHDFR